MKRERQLDVGKRLLGFKGWRVNIILQQRIPSASFLGSVFPTMKTTILIVALLAVGMVGSYSAQTTAGSMDTSQVATPAPTPYQIVVLTTSS